MSELTVSLNNATAVRNVGGTMSVAGLWEEVHEREVEERDSRTMYATLGVFPALLLPPGDLAAGGIDISVQSGGSGGTSVVDGVHVSVDGVTASSNSGTVGL